MEIERIKLSLKNGKNDVYKINNRRIINKIKLKNDNMDDLLYDFKNLKLEKNIDEEIKEEKDILLIIKENVRLNDLIDKKNRIENDLNNKRNLYYLKLVNKNEFEKNIESKVENEINNYEIDLIEEKELENLIEHYDYDYNFKKDDLSSYNHSIDSNDEDNPNNTYPSDELEFESKDSNSSYYDNSNKSIDLEYTNYDINSYIN